MYLEIDSVSKVLGGATVLDGIALALDKGELVGLLGPSGSGKTTLLNLIGGFLEPDGGDIRIAGASLVRVPPYRRDIGISFQKYALFPHMTVQENVGFGLEMRKVPRADLDRRVDAILGAFGLGGYQGRYPRSMSGGEQQRVALARAVITNPRLMLLDEPLANLDANLRHRVRFEIREILKQSEITSIFVTHDQDEAFTLCDKVAVLHRGRIQQYGRPEELIRRPANAFVAGFIGSRNVIAGVVTAAAAERTTVDCNGHSVTARPGYAAKVGDAVNVYVKAEHVRLRPAADAAFEVRDTVHLGHGFELMVKGPVALRVKVNEMESDLLPGSRVTAELDSDLAFVFPADR